MKILSFLLCLLAIPAYATNVLYSPVPDPITNAPSIMYLTDTHSRVCNGHWYKVDIVNSATNKSSLSVPVCWTMKLSTGNEGPSIWIPSTGLQQDNVAGFGPVPGAMDEWQKMLRVFQVQMQREVGANIEAMRHASPHP